jgi:hypothetical protein
VKSIACSAINGKPKLIEAKLDNFEKHEGKRVAVLDNVKRGLKKNDVYHDKECSHLRNVSLFVARRPESVLKLMNGAAAGENRRKEVQYSAIFSVLQHGRPMSDYSSSRFLLEHLKVKHLPTKYWCESSSWEMAHYMYLSILAALARAVQAARVISVIADEVTGVDSTQWLSVHAYVVQNFVRVPLLLHLSHVTDGCKSSNILGLIITALMDEGEMSREEVAAKLVNCGFDGASIFQGTKLE